MASDSETTSQLYPQRSHHAIDPEITPTKRPKTSSSPPSAPSFASKGKSTTLDFESESCGICLSEPGKAIRGFIDSCDHYFCFVCIMEWAKVESRCPMCKRRFSTIRRSPKAGIFLTERVVDVPVRDQVYHYFGNTTVGPSYQYSEVQCTVCTGAEDESFLLLCDLCDSAAHTYCVGLGATVPEGDWFCQDCTVSKAEQDKSEADTDCDLDLRSTPQGEQDVSILDIVRESMFREVERRSTVPSQPNEFSFPVVPGRATDSMAELGSRKSTIPPTAIELGARTLQHCRNVHHRIRELRENWNSFRRGSLSFSSGIVDSRLKKNQCHSSGPIPHDRSSQPHKGSSLATKASRSSYDVEKAWKMMEVAESMGRGRGRTSFGHQASKCPLNKANSPAEKVNTSMNFLASSSKLHGTTKITNAGPQKHYQCHSPAMGNGRHMSQVVLNQNPSIGTVYRILDFGESSPSAQLSCIQELPSSRKGEASVQVDVSHKYDEKPSGKKLPATSSDIFYDHGRSACLTSPIGSVIAASNMSSSKVDVSSSIVELPYGKAKMEKSCVRSKSRRDDAKSEIQSLVKLNLKLLIGDRKIGVDEFKEIARLSTHSILAACSLEHPKSGILSFPSTVCLHASQVQQLRMSTLMPSCCRECFYVFVKDVVNTILFEKASC